MDYKIITISKKELYAEGVITADECIADVPIDVIPRLMLRMKRDEVIEAYCKAFEFTPEKLAEYEGGIDNWIGFGSVTCWELGGGTLVGYGCNELQMVVLG